MKGIHGVALAAFLMHADGRANEADIDACVVLLGQRGSRFGIKVDHLLKELKAQESRPD